MILIVALFVQVASSYVRAQTSGPLDPLMQRIVTFTSTSELERNIHLVIDKVDMDHDGDIT